MTNNNFFKTTLVAASMLVIIGCQTTPDAPTVSSDGLALKHQSRSTLAYKKEGVNFAEYDKIQILASQVAFKKNWQRNYNRDQSSVSTRINDEQVLNIKTELAKLFDEVFQEEFSKDSLFTLVDKTSSGTLIIKPAVINLDVNAPDVRSAANVKTYVSEAGSATIFLEVYDGVSGEILARVVDSKAVGDRSYMHWQTSVSNRADAKRTIRKWAKTLREKFDATKAK